MKLFVYKILALSFIMLALIIGCSSPAGSPAVTTQGTSGESEVITTTTVATTSSVAPEPDVHLVFATFKSDWVPMLEDLFEIYMADNPNVKSIDIFTGPSGNYFDDLKTQIASGTLANIFNLRGDEFGREWKEHLQDVTGTDAVNSVKNGFTDSFTWDGMIYGAYFNYEVHGIVWNMEMLNQIGFDNVPKTKSEFDKVIELSQDAGLPTGICLFGSASYLYNQIGTIPFNIYGNYKENFNNLINGTTDIVNDKNWNIFYDFLESLNAAGQPDSLSTNAETSDLGLLSGEYLFALGGTYLAVKAISIEPDFGEKFRVGPYVAVDDREFYAFNNQGFVVGNQGDEATNKAALKFYDWWYTNEQVATVLTNEAKVLLTNKNYVAPDTALDAFTIAARDALTDNNWAPIRYNTGDAMNRDWAAAVQKFIASEMTREESLAATGELFRAEAYEIN